MMIQDQLKSEVKENKMIHKIALFLTVALFSFLGGLLNSFFLSEQKLYAQDARKPIKVIEAEEIRLVDGDGKTIAKIGQDSDGVGLKIYGKDGKRKIELLDKKSLNRGFLIYDDKEQLRALYSLSLSKDAVELTIGDNNKTPRISLEQRKDGSGLYFNSENGKPLTKVLATNETAGFFIHRINGGAPEGGLTIGRDDSMALNFLDKTGKIRLTLGIDKIQQPSIQIGGRDERIIWRAP
jgi:hypothetical protein